MHRSVLLHSCQSLPNYYLLPELRHQRPEHYDQLKKQDSEIKELKAMVQQLLAAQDKKAATK